MMVHDQQIQRTATPRQTGRLRRHVLSVILGLVLAYALVLASIYALQGWLIYRPDRAAPEETEREALRLGLAPWPGGMAGYRGLVLRTPGLPGPRGTIIVAHGNGGSAVHRLYDVAALQPLGFSVLIAEYPGFGARPGRPNEQRLVEDLRQTVRLLAAEQGGPIYLWGESLGCGVVAEAAADPTLPVAGIALVTPWDSLPDLAQALYWFVPIRYLMRERYDSVANLAGFRGPVAVVMAGADQVIPKRLTRRLYDALQAPKRLWVLPEEDHNSWAGRPDAPWWREVASFISATSDRRTGTPAAPQRRLSSIRAVLAARP